MSLVSGLVVTSTASAAGTYSTTGAINVRTGPTTSAGVITSVPKGTSFTLLCQWQGGTNVNGNATWDYAQFSNGVTGAVSDYWTTTPSWNSYAPNTAACGNTSTSAGSGTVSAGSGSIGGVNIALACQVQQGNAYTATVLDTGNAYSWRCVAGAAATGVDVNAACSYQYQYGAAAGLSSSSNAYSWYCYYSVGAREQTAVNWANANIGKYDYDGWCQKFVENSYGVTGQEPSALSAITAFSKIPGYVHNSTTNIPLGALVYSRNNYDQGSGHVIISRGDGTFVSPSGPTSIVSSPAPYAGGTFLGWVYAPTSPSWPR